MLKGGAMSRISPFSYILRDEMLADLGIISIFALESAFPKRTTFERRNRKKFSETDNFRVEPECISSLKSI